jgi:hypothetical protein
MAARKGREGRGGAGEDTPCSWEYMHEPSCVQFQDIFYLPSWKLYLPPDVIIPSTHLGKFYIMSFITLQFLDNKNIVYLHQI